MDILLSIPEYSSKGIKIEWVDGFKIETKFKNGRIKIVSNKEGLISLAKLFLTLSQDNIPSNYHLILDECSSLEEGSIDLVIEKK